MRVEAVALRDQVIDADGTSVVMVGKRVLVLSPLATEILVALDGGGASLGTLVDHLVSTYGAPAEGEAVEELVEALLGDLAARRLVRYVTKG